jgi:hypothetical protein
LISPAQVRAQATTAHVERGAPLPTAPADQAAVLPAAFRGRMSAPVTRRTSVMES